MAFDSIKNALFPKDDTESIEDESYDVDSKSVSKNGSKMVLVEPRAYSESQTIAFKWNIVCYWWRYAKVRKWYLLMYS